jgi:cbb3-type cytochrome c oxidase subunit III
MRKFSWLILATAVTACSAPADAPSESGTVQVTASEHVPVALTESQAEGRVIFETMCWTCHGAAGRGDGPAVAAGSIGVPPTFHSDAYSADNLDAVLRRFRGSLDGTDENHTHMQYVASLLAPERFAEALSFVPALTWPEELPGGALAGEGIYEFRCIGCHGETGRGDGTAAASLATVQPADFTTDTLLATGDWDAIHARIREGGQGVHGSSMPPWGVALSDNDVWDLVAYLATFQPGLLDPPAWSN